MTVNADLEPAVARLRWLAMDALLAGNLDEAIMHFREVVQLWPADVEAHLNLAHCLLVTGQLSEGWKEIDWRFRPPYHPKDTDMPYWEGQPLNGETVVVHYECGFGDAMQFFRFVPQIVERGGRAVVIVPPQLHRLVGTLDGVDAVWSQKLCRLPLRYYVSPVMRLAHVLGIELENIPSAPYFRADPAPWADFLDGLPGLKVGLVWAGDGGGPKDPNKTGMDGMRSMRLADMAPLFDVPDISFVSLQLGPPAAQMRDIPPGVVLHNVADRLSDWLDTANLIMGLNLIITVDTAVSHLAGALGKPVWLLNRFDTCWRWLMHRSDSPWYPTMRIFRQTEPYDWTTVIAEVAGALHDFRPT